jgi:hypothetical protein
MSYRLSGLAVRWPEKAITVCGATPARMRCRTPERRRSWPIRPASPTFEHYNHGRLHQFRQNVTPADVYEGRQGAILERRVRIKRETLARRKRENLTAA